MIAAVPLLKAAGGFVAKYWKVIALALLVGIYTWKVYSLGVDRERGKWEAKEAKTLAKQQKEKNENETAAQEQAKKARALFERTKRELEEERRNAKEKLHENTPDSSACRVSDVDAGVLNAVGKF